MFRDELYKKINRSEEEVLKAFNELTIKQQNELLYSYGINSKGHSYSGNKLLLRILTNKIDSKYKKSIFELFPNYTNTQVLNAFNLLKYKSQLTLLKIYTLSNNKELIEELTPREKSKIRYYIKCMDNTLKNNITKESKVVYKGFTKIYGISLEEGLKIINHLNIYDKTLIFKKYGTDLSSTTKRNNLTSEENEYINTVISKKIRRYINKLNNGYISVSFYDLFDDVDKSDLIERFNELSKIEKNKFTKIFGSELDRLVLMTPKEKENIFKSKLKIKQKLTKKSNIKDYIFIPFFDLFKEYKLDNETDIEFEERVRKTLLNLNNIDLNIVYKKYGTDLKNTKYYGQFTTEDSKYIFKNVYYLMKYYLGKEKETHRSKKVMERLETLAPHKEALMSLCYLSEENLETLRKYYGFTLEKRPNEKEFDKETQTKIKYAIEQARRTIIKEQSYNLGLKVIELKNIKKILSTRIFKDLSKIYDKNILFAYFIRLKYPKYNDETIYKITGVNLSEVSTELTNIDTQVKKMYNKF